MDVSEAYAALGLPPGSTMDDVKAAYRQRALQCHPDTSGAAQTAEFIRITTAYNILVKSPGSTGAYPRYAPGPSVYASGFSGSRAGRTATVVWGVGLGMGGMLFAGVLLLGRYMVPMQAAPAGPSRRVEPTPDAEKRERIARLLMERTALKGGIGGGNQDKEKQ